MIVIHSIGPYLGIEVYWGYEKSEIRASRPSVLSAWLVEDMEPFRRSTHGCQIILGRHILHLGTCKRGEDPYRRGVAPVDEISEWRRPHVPSSGQDDGSDDPGTESLGPPAEGGPLPGIGVGASNGHTPG